MIAGKRYLSVLVLLLGTSVVPLKAQSPFIGMEHLFTTPRSYVAKYVSNAPQVDGDLSDQAWQSASWSETFEGIEGDKKPRPRFTTRMKMLWDDEYLYIGAELEEPDVWATLSKRDQVVFHDNDFEVFIDPDNNAHQYFEIEVNALNNIFDLFLSKPYRSGGSALFAWDCPGLKSAVKVRGTLNDATDRDQGWNVEFAIPFKSISLGNSVRIPKSGEIWRINFSRVEWDVKANGATYEKLEHPEHNWVWSPQGVVEMHRPERWGYLQFSRSPSSDTFVLPYSEKQRQYLWAVFYKQNGFYRAHKRYATTLAELGLKSVYQIGTVQNKLVLMASSQQFLLSIQATGHASISINNEGLVK